MTKEEKLVLKKLKEEKNYEEIFRQFGQEEFKKSVDRKYKKQDIAKLKKEGKFEDIYLRYGESVYNRMLHEIKQREIEEVYGKKSIKAISNKASYRIKRMLGALIYSVGILGGTTVGAIGGATIAESEMIKSENEKQYEEIIEEYEDNIKNYAENIKAMGLTDLETFMKLQEDMHNSIQGYGTPKLDIEGYFGVDIGQENGVGICRNMADDIACKLNAINPDYNARMIVVYMEVGENDKTDIERNYVEYNGKSDKFGELEITNLVEKIEPNNAGIYLGNHAVVAVDLKDENITLIIDPTTLCLGAFKDGKITLFNSLGKENPTEMQRAPIRDLSYRGIESLETPSEYIKSFLNPSTSIEELNEKYGIEAQQEALRSAREKEQNYIYSQSKEKKFKNSLKVDLQEQKEDIYSMEEIEKLYNECMENIDNIKTPEEAIKMGNTYRKIVSMIEYYNQQQEEIIGKSVNDYAKISNNLDFDMNDLRENIATKMVETNAVDFPERVVVNNIISDLIETDKEFLCEAYLQAGSKETLQDLKFTIDRNNYYILNNNSLLATVNIGFTENTYSKYDSNNSNDAKTADEIKELLAKSSSITEIDKQTENSVEER